MEYYTCKGGWGNLTYWCVTRKASSLLPRTIEGHHSALPPEDALTGTHRRPSEHSVLCGPTSTYAPTPSSDIRRMASMKRTGLSMCSAQ